MYDARFGLLISCGALIIVALLANAAIKFHNMARLIENDRLVAHSHEVKGALNSITTNLVTAESSARGYVLSGRREFLRPFEEAEQHVDSDFKTLGELLSDNRAQLDALAELREMQQQHLKFLSRVIEETQLRDPDAAVALVKTGTGQQLMEAMRTRVAEMHAVEDRLLTERGEVAKNGYQEAQITGGVGTLLSLLVTALAIAAVVGELRRRHAAEVALQGQVDLARLNAEQFRLLTETIPVHIWIAADDGTLTFSNRSWQDYTGRHQVPDPLPQWTGLLHPDDAPRIQAIWREHSAKTAHWEEVRLQQAADRSFRWHRCAVVPMVDTTDARRSWIGSLTDIQAQKDQSQALEEAVRARTQELHQSNQALQLEVAERSQAERREQVVAAELRRSNGELEKFAYVASHDLQEPLRKIQAFGDRLQRKSQDLDEQSRTYVERMLAAATRMRTLIDDLLSFSRVATTPRAPKAVDLNEVLREVLADLESTLAQAQGRVQADALPTVEADPLQMRQLLQNLIGNALKFARPDAPPEVSITAARLEALPPDADPPASFAGWRITIADNGIGFDPQHADRIFEVFQRLHGRDQYPGTGIGLAICRKIVERWGGVLSARGQPGVGARFHIDLPQNAAPT